MKEEKISAKHKSQVGEYIAAIVANIALIYVANNLLNWHIPHLTSEFLSSLWIFNIAFVLTITLNLLFLAFDAKWFKSLGRFLTNVVSAIAIYTFYTVFPLDLTGGNEQTARVIIVIALIGTLIGALVEAILFIVRLAKSE